MTLPRLTIAQLMVLILYVGLCLVALRNANVFWASATYTLAVLTVSAALVGAIARKGKDRMIWTGVAVFGWAYLLVSRLPDMNTPMVGRQPGPYLLIEWGATQLVPYIYGSGTVINWPQYDQVSQSIGIVLFGLVGAVAGHLLAVKDDSPNL